MKSLRSLYRIGLGPSSSHTMGPNRAAKIFAERCPNVDSYRVTLYGSLAATGEGHMTDKAIMTVLEPLAKLELVWKPETFLPFHPNGMLFEGIKEGKVIDKWTIYSIGGGELANEETTKNEEDIYPLTTIHEIMDWCDETGCTFWEYVEKYEGPSVWDFLTEVCSEFRKKGIRTSIFVDPDPRMAEAAALCGCDRVELYTESYASMYPSGPEAAIEPFLRTAEAARAAGLGVNAGHDLNLENLEYFIRTIPWTEEVSIGHAIICDALYMGLEQTIKAYLSKVKIF